MFPFKRAIDNDRHYFHIAKKNFEKFWEQHEFDFERMGSEIKVEDYSAGTREMIFALLSRNPLERPNIKQIRESAWFNQDKMDLNELK